MPLAGHGLRPTPLRRRAGRPQLKRDPLGSSIAIITRPMTTPDASASTRPSTKLLVASTLAWLAGVLQVLIAFAVGWPQIALHGRLPLLILGEGLFGIALCVAGYLLRKRRRAGGIVATVALGATVLVHLATGTLLSAGTGITLLVLVLVLMTWGELR